MTHAEPIASGLLSPALVDQYWADGFLFPLDAIPAETIADYREELEAIETRWRDADLPLPLNTYLRVNAHIVLPMVDRIARDPRVLDLVEPILGPDIMVYSGEFFIKEPRTRHIVSMHQDLTYWGLGAIDGLVTAWIPLSPATRASGCMDFVRGSHKNAILDHEDTFAEDNLLSRGQEVTVEVAEADKTAIELQPGQISLHHGLTIHGSGPNISNDRRIACVIRYVRPDMKQQVGGEDHARLVRGKDRHDNFRHTRPPTSDFSPDARAIYDTVRAAQAKVLMKGATRKIGMYS